jgi:hypothetical protein
VDLIGHFFSLLSLVTLVFVGCAVFALIDALLRRPDAFVAAGKLTKPAWAIILGLSALLLFWFSVLSFFGLPAMVAIIVYFVDVRPAVRGLTGGSRGNEGPYGPW